MSTKLKDHETGEAPEVDPSKFTAEQVAEIADRLERDDYASAFESLNDWHILRSLAFKGSELAEPYRHLLDVEAFDES
jgi:hypothetical protein